ncbi:MAG: TlpA family protein disulfide reductase [Clostridiales bacterium]|nr:TlpA family protein disulfide reductase [Clostridiales bacterium]
MKLIKVIAIVLSASLIFASCDAVDLDFVIGEFSGNTEASEREKAPDFTVYDAAGNKVQFSDYKGKPVVIYLWSDYCYSDARTDLTDLDNANRKYGDDIVFMPVHLSKIPMASRDAAIALMQGLFITAYYDLDNSAVDAYSVTAYPRMIFVDSDGYSYLDQTGGPIKGELDFQLPRFISNEPHITPTPPSCSCK